MSAKIQQAVGVYSTGATWVGGVAPNTTDTITWNDDLTLTASTSVGSSPNTGGTAAITCNASDGKTFALGGNILISKGDVTDTSSSYNGRNVISATAGGGLTLKPPSGQQYGFLANGVSGLEINLTGTALSPCVLSVDTSLGGLAGISTNGPIFGKYINFNLDHVNLSDFGTATQIGIGSLVIGSHNESNTNCLFTRCNWQASFPAGSTGSLTFEDNKFVSSVPAPSSGFDTIAYFSVTSGIATSSIARNVFDGHVRISFFDTITFADNVMLGGIFFESSVSTWTTDARCTQNYYAFAGGGSALNFYGPIKRQYFCQTGDGGHGIGGTSTKDCVFDWVNNTDGQTDDGDLVFVGGANDWSVIGNVAIPTPGSHVDTGTLITLQSPAAGIGTVDHNTANGYPQHSHGGTCLAGQIGSYRNNIVFSATGGANLMMTDTDHPNSGGQADVVAPDKADYNLGWNVNRTTPGGGYAYTHGIKGYRSNFSADPGAHDDDFTTNPFVDWTMNQAKWSVANGGANSVAGAQALLAANPLLIGQATTGLLDTVRAGFRVTGAEALAKAKDAGSDSVTIGAMPYVSSVGFTVSPSTIPKNHAGPITLTLTGTGTAWDGTTVFDLSGAPDVVQVGSTVINSPTSATIVVHT